MQSIVLKVNITCFEVTIPCFIQRPLSVLSCYAPSWSEYLFLFLRNQPKKASLKAEFALATSHVMRFPSHRISHWTSRHHHLALPSYVLIYHSHSSSSSKKRNNMKWTPVLPCTLQSSIYITSRTKNSRWGLMNVPWTANSSSCLLGGDWTLDISEAIFVSCVDSPWPRSCMCLR